MQVLKNGSKRLFDFKKILIILKKDEMGHLCAQNQHETFLPFLSYN